MWADGVQFFLYIKAEVSSTDVVQGAKAARTAIVVLSDPSGNVHAQGPLIVDTVSHLRPTLLALQGVQVTSSIILIKSFKNHIFSAKIVKNIESDDIGLFNILQSLTNGKLLLYRPYSYMLILAEKHLPEFSGEFQLSAEPLGPLVDLLAALGF